MPHIMLAALGTVLIGTDYIGIHEHEMGGGAPWEWKGRNYEHDME